MRVRAAWRWVFAFGVLAVAAGPAGAQQPGTPPPVAPGAGAADGQVSFQGKRSLTPTEQLAEGNSHVLRISGVGDSVRRMLKEARAANDVVKTLCLSDKLNQIDVSARTARERRDGLTRAVKDNNVELSNHEFSILTILRNRAEQLQAQANQCIGEESAFVGDTKTTVQVDPGIAQEEAQYPQTDPTTVIGPPQCISCSL